MTDEIALVTTADFITPPTDDPFRYGQIAAANAISDVYAMGGRPLTCLSLVSYPSRKLGPEMLERILLGALDKITEAGAVLAGGHSVEDDEPKFGLAVTGIVHPQKYWTNGNARPGDALILTKPLGSGVLFNANRKGWVSAGAMDACIETIVTLNRIAAETLSGFPAHAVTDVTGFGLAGHGLEMARASDVCLNVAVDDLPVMAEALAMYRRGMTTGVNAANRQMLAVAGVFEQQRPSWHQELLFDPQTSGGLLVSIPDEAARGLIAALHGAGITEARIIGSVDPPDGPIHLRFR